MSLSVRRLRAQQLRAPLAPAPAPRDVRAEQEAAGAMAELEAERATEEVVAALAASVVAQTLEDVRMNF